MAKRIEKKVNAIEEKTAIDLSKVSLAELLNELEYRNAIKQALENAEQREKAIKEAQKLESEKREYKEALQTIIRLQDKFENKASVHTEAKTDTQANMIDSLLAVGKTVSEIAQSLIIAGYFDKASKAKARVNRRIAALKIRESRA